MGFNLSVLVPAFNEALNLPRLMAELYKTLEELTDDFEIILINDGSKDNTRDLLPGLQQAYPKLIIVSNPKNTGYGACLKTGILKARCDFFTLIPGNCKFKPQDLKILIGKLQDYDVVLGYRTCRADSLKRKVFTWGFKLAIRLLFNITFKDIHWVKLYRSAAIKGLTLNSRSIAAETELMVKLLKLGKKFTEVEVGYLPRTQGSSSADKLSNLAIFFKEIIALKVTSLLEH